MPTLLDYAGCSAAHSAEGVSLRPLIEGGAEESGRIVISEYHDFCATTRQWKLITCDRTLEPAALYDLHDDPYEFRNRIDDPVCADAQARLIDALSMWRARVGPSERQPGEDSRNPTQPESDLAWHPINI